MAATDQRTPGQGSGLAAVHPVFDVFPVAFLMALPVAAAHAFVKHQRALGGGFDGEVAGYRLVAIAERWPEVLAEALIAAGVGAMALRYATTLRPERGAGAARLATAGALLIAFLAALFFITGWPSDATRSPALEAVPGPSSPFSGAALIAAAGVSLMSLGLIRLRVGGKVATALCAALCLGGAWFGARQIAATQPGQAVRHVVVDVVAAPSMWTVVTQRPDAEVRPGVMTPIVDQTTDTGDKPSIILPPRASVQFSVPVEARGARLMAAAGADLSLFRGHPDGLDVDYRVYVNDGLRWESRYEHRQVNWREMNTHILEWRHVTGADGERGLEVEPGDIVRLETDLAEGVDPESLDPETLILGFGGVRLERTSRTPRRVATPAHPNVVFIVMDTLRRDRVGCYGYGRNTTPNIDGLASRGMRFDGALTTSSWTWPSTASLLTGLPVEAHGVKDSASCTLNHRLRTLPEALQAEGYTTGAFVGNPIVEPSRQFDQGFEAFDVVPGVDFRMSDEVMPAALDWIDAHAPLRFFLYLHLVDPHTPHRPHPDEARRMKLGPAPAGWPEKGMNALPHGEVPSPPVAQYARDLYDASVATGDRYVGQVLARIEELGLEGSTVICFTSDHGEELFDHGEHGHGHAVWAELVDAPLILAGPGIPRGVVRDGAVSNRHVAPTLAALAGARLDAFDDAVMLHTSAMPDLAHFQTSKGKWGTARYQEILGLRRDVFVTHWRMTPAGPSSAAPVDLRIFDAPGDPAQTKDLVSVRAAEAREAAVTMEQFRERAAEVKPPLVLGVGEAGREGLGGIGYDEGDAGMRER